MIELSLVGLIKFINRYSNSDNDSDSVLILTQELSLEDLQKLHIMRLRYTITRFSFRELEYYDHIMCDSNHYGKDDVRIINLHNVPIQWMREKVEFIDIGCRPYDNFMNFCITSVPTSEIKLNPNYYLVCVKK